MKVIDAISKRLIFLLEEKKLSQYALCKKVAIDPSNIYNIMYGRCKTITVDKLFLIAEGLDMTVREFLDDPLFAKENIEVD
jgi:transcriptional regulator with XRE-family HTH domain